MTSRRLFLTTLMTGLAVSGMALAQPYSGAPLPPPYRPIPERRREDVPPPRPGMLWEPGHWHWMGRDYVWIRGRFVRRRPEYHLWVEGHWERRGPGWAWVPSHWE